MIQIKWKSMLTYVLVILLGVSAALILYFYQIFYKSDQFLPGVKIASASVSGYERNNAAHLLDAEFKYLYDTPLSFHYRDYRYDTRLGEIVKPPDSNKIIAEVWEQEKKRRLISKILNMDGAKSIEYPVKIAYDENKLNNISGNWKKDLESDYVNAALTIDPDKGLIVWPSKKGTKVDIPSTLALLPGEWKQSEKLLIEMVVSEENPLISENELKNMGEISTFTTWYNPKQVDRSHNVVLATGTLNGVVLKPEEIFSFNQTVGQLSYEKGYRDALVIIGGKFEPGLGGGLCQVSTTIYNACLLAGLEIVERHNHNLAIAYAPLGQDATVVHGAKDFRFRNTMDEPIYIWSNAGNGKVTVNIYGNLKYKQKIQLSHVVDQVIDFKEIRETKNDLKPGTTTIEQAGSPGYVVRSFRTFYNNDGTVARREQLARDYYQPLNRLVYVGASADPDVPVREIPGDLEVPEVLAVDPSAAANPQQTAEPEDGTNGPTEGAGSEE